ncbi:hypothetical protein CVT25_007577 [Psilocybe cyanescens]|uniref:FAD/NAD(P)-binding domain-containing protein n=1 Tax=Psilocybe cyanescens TaxID=93625 RepID=A0A409WVV8_PSICY|nr:hypothetical protein CVT25_007577 [Psilocybe cyanescens]
MDDDRKNIAIVGGGASGSRTAHVLSITLDESKFNLILLPTSGRAPIVNQSSLEESILVSLKGTFIQTEVISIEKGPRDMTSFPTNSAYISKLSFCLLDLNGPGLSHSELQVFASFEVPRRHLFKSLRILLSLAPVLLESLTAFGPKRNTEFIVRSSGATVLSNRGLVRVLPTLQMSNHPEIYVIGDVIDYPKQKQAGKAIMSTLSWPTSSHPFKKTFDTL